MKDNSLQTFKAKAVGPSTISNASSKASGKKSSNIHKSPTAKQGITGRLKRHMIETRTTLENVDLDNLEPTEIMFYEDAIKKAVEIAQVPDDNGIQIFLSSVIVEDDQQKHGSRGLRGGSDRNGSRALWGWSRWYDIWAVMELFSCRFCENDDDDDFFATTSVVDTTTNHHIVDDDDDYSGIIPMREIDHGFHRALGVSDNFANVLCDLLRDGPHERFHKVTKCTIEFTK